MTLSPEQIDAAWKRLHAAQDEEALLHLLAGEARGEPIEAQIGVAQVVQHRVRDARGRWSRSVVHVCLQPQQFSCFNHDDPNFEVVADPPEHCSPALLTQLTWVVQSVLGGKIQDQVNGANHYYDFSVIVGKGQSRDPARLVRYLDAVDVVLGTRTGRRESDIEAARDMIHTLVRELPPVWDNEVLPVARKGQFVFFRL